MSEQQSLKDALRRIEQLEHERIVVEALLAIGIKNRLFTAKELETELSIATAILDQLKAEEERK